MKRVAILIAAAALGLTPAAAAAKKPERAKDRGAKVERKSARAGASAQRRCRDERADLGPAAFADRYGKPSAGRKPKAKAARAAFGRCVSQTARKLRAERKAAEEDEESEDDAELDEDVDEDALGGTPDEDGLDEESEDADDGDVHVDHEKGDDEDDEDPDAGLAGDVDLDD